jgi:hypothetical protein
MVNCRMNSYPAWLRWQAAETIDPSETWAFYAGGEVPFDKNIL